MSENIKIAIAEDNSFLLRSITEKLQLFDHVKIKHTAFNGIELIKNLEKYPQVDIILMDIQMPEMDGIEATALVKAKYPQIKIVMLTIYDDDENIFNAIKAGADGYLLKEIAADDLGIGLQEIMDGGAPMTPIIAGKALKLLRKPPEFAKEKDKNPLSKREIQVLEQLSKGLNYNEIATNLIISPATVRKHIENIYGKLQVHNKMEAVIKADKNNWIG